MGHRFSKTAANNIATTATAGQAPIRSQELTTNTADTLKQPLTFATNTTTRRIPIPNGGNNNFVGPTINLQIQESPSGISGPGATCLGHINTSTAQAAAAGILQQQSSSIGCSSSNSSSLTSVNNLSCGRQIIIKIQLAKMENGNEISATTSTSSTATPALLHQQQQDISLETLTADCNLNSSELRAASSCSSSSSNNAGGGVIGAAQILNLTLNSGGSSSSSDNMTTTATTTITQRTAGSSSSTSKLATNNNYLNPSVNNSSTNFPSPALDASSSSMPLRERLGRPLQFNDEIVEQNIGEIVEYCEVLEDQNQFPVTNSSGNSNRIVAQASPLTISEEPEVESNVCCRRKSKSLAANGGATSSSSKRRCRKCSCRDAFRRILDPSLSRSSNKAQKQQQQQLEQERKEQKQSRAHERHSIANIPSNRNVNTLQMQRNSMHSTTIATTSSGAATAFVVPPGLATSVAATTTASPASQVAVWGAATTTNGSDVIIPLTTPPQFVFVQCAIVNPTPATANNTHHHITHNTSSSASNPNLPRNSIIAISHNPLSSTSTASSSHNDMVNVPQHPSSIRSPPPTTTTAATMSGVGPPAPGPVVHSQVDFVHYLVPDLERITNSSFYWGKMDRYEAERLLEGKPEGTFLLRDSAQEEFLFSVTFRKYGRSLHARIEQSGHRFSFDCHDPCVYTASTVTGLLEHYKDPACVMFFEPMLTIPLHRKNCFSLQQLCRATIVSNTTYDGINELELPARLKSYLKEYHYKQKLRVKLNEPTYTIHCK